jgi:BTB/POZ domain
MADMFHSGFKELWSSKLYSDLTIVGGLDGASKDFAVHKCVLAAQSTVFSAIFEKESRSGMIDIKDFKVDAVEGLLYFIYTGEMKDDSNAIDLFAIASNYDVQPLKTIAEQIISSSTNHKNAYEIFSLGHLHNSDRLKQAGFDGIRRMFPEIRFNRDMINKLEELSEIVEARHVFDKKIADFQSKYNL